MGPWFDPVDDVLELSNEFYILGYGMITKHFLDTFSSNNIPSCKLSIFSNHFAHFHCISGKNRIGIFLGRIKLWKNMVDIEIFLHLYCTPYFLFCNKNGGGVNKCLDLRYILLGILQILCTLQKKEDYAWWNDLEKCFKICHIFGLQKPQVVIFYFSFFISCNFIFSLMNALVYVS